MGLRLCLIRTGIADAYFLDSKNEVVSRAAFHALARQMRDKTITPAQLAAFTRLPKPARDSYLRVLRNMNIFHPYVIQHSSLAEVIKHPAAPHEAKIAAINLAEKAEDIDLLKNLLADRELGAAAALALDRIMTDPRNRKVCEERIIVSTWTGATTSRQDNVIEALMENGFFTKLVLANVKLEKIMTHRKAQLPDKLAAVTFKESWIFALLASGHRVTSHISELGGAVHADQSSIINQTEKKITFPVRAAIVALLRKLQQSGLLPPRELDQVLFIISHAKVEIPLKR